MSADIDPIDIESDSDESWDSEASTVGEDVPLELPRIDNRQRTSTNFSLRNRPLQELLWTTEVAECFPKIGSLNRIRVGDTVELGATDSAVEALRAGDFGRVIKILRNETNGKISLRIWRFRRLAYVPGAFDKKLNEVCLILEPDEDDDRPLLEQCVDDVFLEDVYKKRKLLLTNQQFPGLRCPEIQALNSHGENYDEHKWTIRNSSSLVCRWAYISKFRRAVDRRNGKHFQQVIRPISIQESDEGCSVPEYLKYMSWRETLDSENPNFTFGDGFCGCGGVSVAAVRAGFTCRWAFDKDQAACTTYLLNNPNAMVEHRNATTIPRHLSNSWRVSVLHLSPPCQAFSRMNATAGRKDPNSVGGRNDDENSAALFSIPALLDAVRPRVVTIEEVDNLVAQHKDFYYSLLRFFTSAGYSVRSAVMNLADYGVPQGRKRLILFASCPGEGLPEFPAPTHGPGRVFPYVTIHDAIHDLGPQHTRHSPRSGSRNDAPYSAHSLSNTIMTSGAKCHPSGDRPFTVRELARIQTFPDSFHFDSMQSDTVCIKQIGNAVPPTGFTPSLEKVRESLEENDVRRAIEMTQE